MRCIWAGGCDREATVILVLLRPCGHPASHDGRVPTCPGHAEAHVGDTAKRATACPTCGAVNFPAANPGDVEAVSRG